MFVIAPGIYRLVKYAGSDSDLTELIEQLPPMENTIVLCNGLLFHIHRSPSGPSKPSTASITKIQHTEENRALYNELKDIIASYSMHCRKATADEAVDIESIIKPAESLKATAAESLKATADEAVGIESIIKPPKKDNTLYLLDECIYNPTKFPPKILTLKMTRHRPCGEGIFLYKGNLFHITSVKQPPTQEDSSSEATQENPVTQEEQLHSEKNFEITPIKPTGDAKISQLFIAKITARLATYEETILAQTLIGGVKQEICFDPLHRKFLESAVLLQHDPQNPTSAIRFKSKYPWERLVEFILFIDWLKENHEALTIQIKEVLSNDDKTIQTPYGIELFLRQYEDTYTANSHFYQLLVAAKTLLRPEYPCPGHPIQLINCLEALFGMPMNELLQKLFNPKQGPQKFLQSAYDIAYNPFKKSTYFGEYPRPLIYHTTPKTRLYNAISSVKVPPALWLTVEEIEHSLKSLKEEHQEPSFYLKEELERELSHVYNDNCCYHYSSFLLAILRGNAEVFAWLLKHTPREILVIILRAKFYNPNPSKEGIDPYDSFYIPLLETLLADWQKYETMFNLLEERMDEEMIFNACEIFAGHISNRRAFPILFGPKISATKQHEILTLLHKHNPSFLEDFATFHPSLMVQIYLNLEPTTLCNLLNTDKKLSLFLLLSKVQGTQEHALLLQKILEPTFALPEKYLTNQQTNSLFAHLIELKNEGHIDSFVNKLPPQKFISLCLKNLPLLDPLLEISPKVLAQLINGSSEKQRKDFFSHLTKLTDPKCYQISVDAGFNKIQNPSHRLYLLYQWTKSTEIETKSTEIENSPRKNLFLCYLKFLATQSKPQHLEAWVVLAVISQDENNSQAKETYLNNLKRMRRHASRQFFFKNNTSTVNALLECTPDTLEEKDKHRGVEALIDALSDKIKELTTSADSSCRL